MSIQQDKLTSIANSIRKAKQEKDNSRKIVANNYPQEIEGIPQAYSDYVLNKEYSVNNPLILGVEFPNENSEGIRTNDSKDFVVEIANDITSEVRNDFDNVFPFNYMKEHMRINNNGRIVTRIPRYARKLRSDYTKLQISPVKIDDTWEWAPAFVRADGSLRDYYDHGCFQTSENGLSSKPGVMPAVNMNIDQYRAQARSIGKGWIGIDIEAWECYWDLWLIVTANRDCNAVMKGNVNVNPQLATGGTNNAKSTLVQISNTHQSFYGIENEYSGTFTYVDGINMNGTQVWVCKDIDNYASNTSNNYINIGNISIKAGNISAMKTTKSGIVIPVSVAKGRQRANWCYFMMPGNGWKTLRTGRNADNDNNYGLFTWVNAFTNTGRGRDSCSRLIYKP